MFLFGSGLVMAEQIEPVTNEQAAQSWQQTGAQTPGLAQQDDGSTRVDWQGSVAADAYTNKITTANGSTNTPLQSGTFYKGVVQGDLRGINPAGTVNYLQFGMTHSNDRSVLSLYPNQINNIQLGRTGQGYSMAAGDIAPNFSSLSSALGARGITGQKQLGDTATIYGYGGVAAESWEALDNTVLRNQFIRDVYGLKLEKSFTPSLKVYATGQAGADQAGSITNPLVSSFALAAKLHASSIGFQYAENQFQLAGETANSGYQQETQAGRSGRGSILDAGWRGQTVGLRAGYHDIDSGFMSLSTMVMAGIKEAYSAIDWTAASWLTLGADLRNSKNTTLATIYTPSQTSNTDSSAVRANINFGPDLPGWGVSLQKNDSKTLDALSNISRNEQNSTTLNYASQNWTTMLGYGLGKTRNSAYSVMDSDTTSWQYMLGRSFSDAAMANWSANVSLNTTLQNQQLLSGTSTRNVNYLLTFTGQRTGWGNLNLILANGLISRPTGQPDLKLRSAQLEAVHPLTPRSNAKIYVRDSRSNIGDPLLGLDERVAGAQYTCNF